MATTEATLESRNAEVAYYIRIEGIGVYTKSTSCSVYCFTRLPDWTEGATETFITGLEIPPPWSQDVPIMGGIASQKPLVLTVNDFTTNAAGTTWYWASLLAGGRPILSPGTTYPLTYVSSDTNRSATTIECDNAGDFSAGQLCIGNETAKCTGVDTVGQHSFTTVTRGLHNPSSTASTTNNFALSHDIDAFMSAKPEISTVPLSFQGRKIALWAVHKHDDGTWGTEANAYKLYVGRITRVEYAGDHRWQFSCESLLADLDREVVPLTASTEGYPIVMAADVMARTMVLNLEFTNEADGVPSYFSTFVTAATSYVGGGINGSPLGALIYALNTGLSFAGSPVAVWGGIRAQNTGGPIQIELTPASTHTLTGNVFVGAALAAVLRGGMTTDPLVTPLLSIDSIGIQLNGLRGAAIGTWPVGGTRTAIIHTGGPTSFSLDLDNVQTPYTFDADQGDDGGAGAKGYALCTVAERGFLISFTGVDTTGQHSLTGCKIVSHPMVSGLGSTVLVTDNEKLHVQQVLVPEPGTAAALLLRVMLSSGEEDYINTTYDKLRFGGLGIDDYDVDTGSFTRVLYGDNRRLLITKPTKFSDILNEELKTRGAVVVMKDGKITCRRLPLVASSAVAGVVTLDETNRGTSERTRIDLSSGAGNYNTFTYRWRYDVVRDEFLRTMPVTDVQSVRRTGAARGIEIESRWFSGQNAETILASLFDRLMALRIPMPTLTRDIDRTMWTQLAPGDVVLITDDHAHDPFSGTYGLTTRVGFVQAMTVDPTRALGSVAVRLLTNPRAAPLAPSAMVDYSNHGGSVSYGYDSGALRLYLRANEYSDGTMASPYNVDAGSFLTNDAILVAKINETAPSAPATFWQRTVTGVNSSSAPYYVTINSALSGPAWPASSTDRYIITFDTYATSAATSSSQATRGSFIADDADRRINATNDWYPYAS